MTRFLGRTTWTDHWQPTRRPLLVVPVGAVRPMDEMLSSAKMRAAEGSAIHFWKPGRL